MITSRFHNSTLYEFQLKPYNPLPPVPPKSMWHRFKRIIYFIQFLVKSIPIWINLIIRWIWPPPPKSIAGWTALVTGGSNGIGRGVALELARNGCNVIIADLDVVNGKKTVKELLKLGVKAAVYKVDVSVYEEVVKLGRKIESDCGPVDILVNNAGILSFLVDDEYTPENLRRMVNVNLMSHFWTTSTLLPGMYARGRGHIVALSSGSAYIPTGYLRNYATTKYAVRGFMEELHDEIYHAGFEGRVVTTTVFPWVIGTRKESIEKLLALPGNSELDVTTPEDAGRVIVQGIRNNTRKMDVPNLTYVWPLALTR
ncbi:hypothetical protein quinque_000450 [Culex quinquefasciatus]|uniref:estradiol 17-beta-dehydrogenase 11 n=1 Tax=Culex quinquefasciatus TaxID=7176 RepID=UPI0018E34E20|nr:estradiol 17-beta-dehydrogenase 11 [Culex quinquefasciatus]